MDSVPCFTTIDLLEYAVDKPIGAVRAALRICLEGTQIGPEAVILALHDDMECNQGLLQSVLEALRINPRGLLEDMPEQVLARKFAIDLGI
ncbi:hypothetical protein [Pseudomonas migulae]|nr:hypothetical protein [uncultured Pseudomonas sp.]